MSVEWRLSNRSALTGVIVVILLSTSGALAGLSEDCAAAAVNVYGQQDYAKALRVCRPLAEQGEASCTILNGRAAGLWRGRKVVPQGGRTG
jgi:hypothetical protein